MNRAMQTGEIREKLYSMQDPSYRNLQTKILPTVDPESVIGVRTPQLRALAMDMLRSGGEEAFLGDLPHGFFDENQLHAFLLSGIRDYDRCIEEVERFLPYVDNWATCDQLSPKVFKKHRRELLDRIRVWIRSGRTYTVRFGIGMLMQHFLDGDFDPAYLEMAAGIRSEEYYINMMIAWYFATALAKQYDAALPFIREGRLEVWTHNKAIQKAVESFRVTPEHKEYLKTLRRKRND